MLVIFMKPAPLSHETMNIATMMPAAQSIGNAMARLLRRFANEFDWRDEERERECIDIFYLTSRKLDY